MASATSGIQSIERAFSVLLAVATEPAGITDVARRVALPVSTVARLLSTLEHLEAVIRQDDGVTYRIGPTVSSLAAGNDSTLVGRARPFLSELVERVGETAGLSVLAGDEVLYLDHVQNDLEMLTRVNHLVEDGERAFGADFLPKVNALAARRGDPPYRRVETLEIRPSEDIGPLAAHHVRTGKLRRGVHGMFMSPDEVLDIARKGAALGCKEALITLGDKPEERWPEAREWLDAHGYDDTIAYVRAVSIRILEETGLLPHLNPGAMSWTDFQRLRPVAPSKGMTRSTTATRLWS